jgi:hypothetical protein
MRRDALKVVIVTAVLLLGCYAAIYITTVKAVPLSFMTGVGPWIRIPRYSVGGRAADVIFYPANTVDRCIRPRYWQFHEEDLDEPEYSH